VIETVFFSAVFFLSFIGVELLRRWISKREIFDIPNDRSSHTTPTPRGGGLIIVAVSLGFYALGSVILPLNFYWSYFIGAICIALISWFDDLFSISFGWRFLVHSLAAVLVVWNLGFWQIIYIPVLGNIDFGFGGAILTFCWIVWLTNAFNFMDGIDGIAGLQAVTAGIGWLIIGKILGSDNISIFGGILALASFGFLLHNWQPAKIFMGDVGSAFLGYSFAVIPLFFQNEPRFSLSALIGISLMACFIIDSMMTFTKRLLKREKVWEAHRKHFYQKLVIKGYSHQFVTSIYGFISIIIITLLIFWINFQKFD
jgi:UDP-N-acetylmuramyl pentapeptide phosphotransferase/UDP-N-acetylglucosamine-1-phosphate transferase